MTTSETERLRDLLKGTALPWEATEDRPDDDSDDEDTEWFACVVSPHPDTDDRDTVAVVTTGHGIEIDRAHAALIVGAVNALPALLDAADERDALRARVAELEDTIHLRDDVPCPECKGFHECDECGTTGRVPAEVPRGE